MIEVIAHTSPRKRLAERTGGPVSVRPTRDQQIARRTSDLIMTGKQLIREEIWPSANAIAKRTQHSSSVIERQSAHLDRLRRLYVRKWKTHPAQWVDPRKRTSIVPTPEATVPASDHARVREQLDYALGKIEELKTEHASSSAAKDARIAELEQENAFLLENRRPARIRTLLEDRAAKHDAHRPEDRVPVPREKDTGRHRAKKRGSN